LRLFVKTARLDTFEEFDRPRLAINAKFKVCAGQAIDKLALLIENRDIGLHEFRVDLYNVALVLLSRLCPDAGRRRH
jgi:hypothetical protein